MLILHCFNIMTKCNITHFSLTNMLTETPTNMPQGLMVSSYVALWLVFRSGQAAVHFGFW